MNHVAAHLKRTQYCKTTDIYIFIEVWLIYNVVLDSGVQQHDSVIHIYIHILFHILFHYGLSQDIEYSSLCYRVGTCCLWNAFSFDIFFLK